MTTVGSGTSSDPCSEPSTNDFPTSVDERRDELRTVLKESET
jgi:hypothetical protein